MSSFDKERAFHLLEELKKYHRMRDETDYVMPTILPFVPVLLILIGTILWMLAYFAAIASAMGGMGGEGGETAAAAAIGGIGAAAGLLVLGLIINIYVLYKWIDRLNKHSERMKGFFTVLGELVELLNFKHAASMRSRINEYVASYSKRSVGLNIVLSIIIPIYVFYVYHFLNKDFVKHSKLEKLIFMDLFEDIRERNPAFTRRPEELVEVPDRNTILYFIVTIIFSPFLFYWVYTLTKDPNEHFKSHAVLEPEIIGALEKIVNEAAAEESGEELI